MNDALKEKNINNQRLSETNIFVKIYNKKFKK